MNVASIKITTEEDGFHLIIDGDSPCEGYTASILDFNIHAVAVDLLAAVEREIAPWHREGMSVLAEIKAAGAFRCDPDESAGMAEYVVAVREDGSYRVEPDEDAYDPTDPKSAGWRERMADAWDNRDKTERKPW